MRHDNAHPNPDSRPERAPANGGAPPPADDAARRGDAAAGPPASGDPPPADDAPPGDSASHGPPGDPPPGESADASLDPDDHRSLGRRLDLFHFREHAPGMVFWHPDGFDLHRRLQGAARAMLRAQGYREVATPQLLRAPVWEASGHWSHFAGGMIKVAGDGPPAALKPVSCPGHLYIFDRRAPSYRDLPLRLAEFGVVHRDEPSGTLHGLLRLRQFTQDDGHILCERPSQAEAEIERFCAALPRFYRAFGFADVEVALATRPADRIGDDALWDRSEAALARALDAIGQPYAVHPGDGAFYGPKIEFTLIDRAGRPWQCGTIQFDFHMPRAFNVRYVDRDGARQLPVMLHRALFGSVERFLGILLEHHRGRLPAWLAPTQVAVLPLSIEGQGAAAEALAAELAAAGLRARVDDDGSLARRIRRCHDDGVPLQLILGKRELAAGSVTLRDADGQRSLPRDAILAALGELCRAPAIVDGA
ncbi:MAG: threonine--tRNA ligase [Nannocystaceae bacterium]